MAISKLKPRHASEGRSIAAALKDRLDYDKNPEKTDGGLLVTGYQCSPDTLTALGFNGNDSAFIILVLAVISLVTGLIFGILGILSSRKK